MGDEKFRELERRWKETGGVEDEAAYLRERVRAGDLAQANLELAATLGGAAALAWGAERVVRASPELWVPLHDASLTRHSLSEPIGVEDFDAFTGREGLCPWGAWLVSFASRAPRLVRRVATGAATTGYAVWGKVFAPGRISELGTHEWATESLWRLEALCSEIEPPAGTYPRFGGDAFDAADQARSREANPYVWAVEAVGHALYAARHDCPREALLSIRKAASATDGATVLQAIQADLVPWLLGYGDPVRERFAGRCELAILPEEP